MKITKELYNALIDKNVHVVCADGWTGNGVWADHTSAVDNEPDPESITIDTEGGAPVEIFVEEIESIEAAGEGR
jgi:hypothetical protein